MKIKLNKHAGLFLLILLCSILIRFYELDAFGYSTDEPIIITTGIKHFLNNPYSASLFDMATPGGQWPIGLSVTLLSDRDFSIIRDYGIMDYASIDTNNYLLVGLETFARIPSAIAGVISGVLIYLIVKEMYGKKSALISYLLYSFNPIIIDYSRIALLEIFQIVYMLAAVYFFYLSLVRKEKNKHLILTGVFLGLTAAAKMNTLILIPLFVLFSIASQTSISKKKNQISLDLLGFAKNSLLIIVPSVLVFGLVFGFDFSVPLQIYEYYSMAGGTGVQFVLFNLLYDMIFFINPLFWVLLGISLYFIYKDRKSMKMNDLFALFLILIIFTSGFFEAHESIKRGIQYVLLLFIIGSRLFSENNKSSTSKKWLNYVPLIILITNLALVMYYFPNTGLAKSIICTSQECQDAHATRNYNSRLAGEYFDDIQGAVVFDTTETTGLMGFYLNNADYFTGGLSKILIGECPSFDMIKSGGFNYVVDNDGCFSTISNELSNCPSDIIRVKNYEMTTIYDISDC